MITLGGHIKRIRQIMGLTQAELARRAGLSKGYLSTVESGATEAPSVVDKIAQVFGLRAGDLLVEAGYTVHPLAPRAITIYLRGQEVSLFPWPAEHTEPSSRNFTQGD